MKKRNAEQTISVYVATHLALKNRIVRALSHIGYYPIEVGAAKRESHFCTIRDDLGADNISSLNNLYNELTALYWIWKHDSSSRIIGLCHYRRYFSSGKKHSSRFPIPSVLSKQEISHMLNGNEVIVFEKETPKIPSKNNPEKLVFDWPRGASFRMLRDAVKRARPSYLKTFDLVAKGELFFCRNAFIAERNFVALYCDFLFAVLDAVVPVLDVESLQGKQIGACGYYAELLFNVFLAAHPSFQPHPVPYTRIDESKIMRRTLMEEVRRFPKRLSKKIRRITHR